MMLRPVRRTGNIAFCKRFLDSINAMREAYHFWMNSNASMMAKEITAFFDAGNLNGRKLEFHQMQLGMLSWRRKDNAYPVTLWLQRA